MSSPATHAPAIAVCAARSGYHVWVRVRSTDTAARAFRRAALRWVGDFLRSRGAVEAAHVLDLASGGLPYGTHDSDSEESTIAGHDDIMLHLSGDPRSREHRRAAARQWVAGKLAKMGFTHEANLVTEEL